MKGNRCEIFLYGDTHSMIGTALAGAAFSIERAAVDADPNILSELERTPHPRYQCRDHVAYVEAFALPPYLQ